jgi:hypothetical protein
MSQPEDDGCGCIENLLLAFGIAGYLRAFIQANFK